MNAEEAIALMRGPRSMHIICVDVTNKCDLACSNCTRLLENQNKHWDMTPENFRTALRSLEGYFGIIAMIGGNPCMHPKFEELCRIFVEEIPNKMQRGLWTNNYFKHRQLVEETFGTFNLNSHGVAKAEANLVDLHKSVQSRGALSWLYTGHSDHAPLLTAVKDFYPPDEMWERIANCDINKEWSASIVQNKGKLRAYFCEVAASFDLARGTDHGHPLVPGWWMSHIKAFSDQIKTFCPGCGVPAKLKGRRDADEIDDYSATNKDLALKVSKRKSRYVDGVDVAHTDRVTLYNSKGSA
jgi:organic radical activating enzyme